MKTNPQKYKEAYIMRAAEPSAVREGFLIL